jgi:hypothetical protein
VCGLYNLYAGVSIDAVELATKWLLKARRDADSACVLPEVEALKGPFVHVAFPDVTDASDETHGPIPRGSRVPVAALGCHCAAGSKQQFTDQQIAEVVVHEGREAPVGEIARYRAGR